MRRREFIALIGGAGMATRGGRAAAEGLAHRGSRTLASDACHVERVP